MPSDDVPPLTFRGCPRTFLVALLPLLLPVALLRAQQAPPPIDSAAVLAALKEIKGKQAQVIAKEKGQVLDSLRAALADPVKAWEQAVFAVEIQGKGNEGSRIVEWRKQNTDLMRDRAFATALRLQLTYLIMTWQHSMGAKTKDQLPALYDYTNQLTANFDALWSLKMTDKTVNELVFVKYYQIGPYINGLADWETQLFNADAIYNKTILPELRKSKDPRLLAYWDNKIQTEAARFEQKSNGLAVNKFNMIRRPTLLWSRAEDELLLGDQPRAVADMLAIIKSHADHPDFDKWAARLTEVVTPPKGEVIVKDAPTDFPAPPSAP